VLEKGRRVVVDHQGYQNISDVQNTLSQMGDQVSRGSMTKFRQILDAKVSKAGGYYGKTLSEGSVVDAQREGANAIRSQLASQFPDLGKVNAEYSFWKNANKILNDTVTRTKGQQPSLGESIAQAGGGAAGWLKGGL